MTMRMMFVSAFAGFFTWYVCVTPGKVLALSGVNTGYARIISQAEAMANAAFNKSAIASAVSSVATGSTVGSLAVRAIAGLGWAGLAVSAGMALYQVFYSKDQVQQIAQQATGGPYPYSIPGVDPQVILYGAMCADASHCEQADYMGWHFPMTPTGPNDAVTVMSWDVNKGANPCQPPGWSTAGFGPAPHSIICAHDRGKDRMMTKNDSTVTPQKVSDYLGGLPATDPLAPEQNMQPAGVNTSTGEATQPAPADNVVSIPVQQGTQPGQMQSTVVPTSNVQPGDVVVDPNATPPAGTQQTSGGVQALTRTSTATQNADGSTTTHEEEQVSTQCTVGQHSMGSLQAIYDAHAAKWQGTPLLQQLNLFKTLVWPTALPVISLPTAFFGTFTVDFNQWAWFFTALRTMVMAFTTFYSYRLIFAGR